MPIADINGERIFYEDTGGDLPVVAFSHGLLMDHSMFAPQIEALRATHRCIAWDERGHGQTGKGQVANGFSHRDAAADLYALLAHCGVRRAVLVGMSQGGFLSLECALRHPALVRGLVLIGSQAGPENPRQTVGNRALADFWLENGPSETLIENTERILLGEHFEGAATWREKWWQLSSRHFLQCLSAVGERSDLTAHLAEIAVPALVIHGTADVAIPPTAGADMARGLNAELMLVEGAGHAVNLTHPAPVTAALTRFLSALPA